MYKPKWVITGLPRSRTAWLGALLATPKVPVYHDILTYPPEGELYAISDPTVAIMESMHAVADGVPLAIVVRDEQGAFDACEKAFGIPLDQPFRDRSAKAFYSFLARPRERFVMVKYEGLAENDVVQALSVYLTGKEIDDRRLNTFQALNITEDAGRAFKRHASYPQLGVVH